MLRRLPDELHPGGQAELGEYMRSPEFASDPFGPTFDPDAMLAALRAGTPESELLTRAWALTCPQRNVPELLLT